ncbi:unnamed protein product [Cunninghamella echinulata]
MTSTSIATIPPKLISESLGPRGLSIKQQQDIATRQSQAANMSYQSRTSNINHGKTDCLYVGELNPNVEENTLMDIFTQIGPVDNIRICRDAITNKSLGYAYINFSSEVGGERAIQSLNYSLIKGKPCRIMWSQKDSNKMTSKTGNIFIKNLDLSITTKALWDTFFQFGNITHCNVALDAHGQSKGYGFVQYDSAEAAERAINSVNGMTLYNQELFVGHYIPKHERIQKSEEIKQKFTNVFVSNLVSDIKDEELYELFGSYGPITSVSIKRDGRGLSRGSGYVNFDRHEDAKKVVTEMHNTEYGGKRLFVSPAQKRSSSEKPSHFKHRGYNLYIKNLAEDIDDVALRNLFLEFGTITSAKVMRDEVSKRSKGFGFVCFTTLEEANRSIKEMDKKLINNKEIFVAFAQKRGKEESIRSTNPFIPIPNTSFINNGSSFYGSYPPQSNYIVQQPLQWFSTGPPPILQQPNFAAGPVSYTSYPPPLLPPSSSSSPPSSSTIMTTTHTPSSYSNSIHPSSTIPSTSISSSSSSSPPFPLQNEKKDKENDQSKNSSSSTTVKTNHYHHDTSVITLDSLSSLPLESQKQILGQRIYETIQTKHSEAAGKVTGMLLEMEMEDLIELVNNIDLLEERAQEAVNVLKQHEESISDTEK